MTPTTGNFKEADSHMIQGIRVINNCYFNNNY